MPGPATMRRLQRGRAAREVARLLEGVAGPDSGPTAPRRSPGARAAAALGILLVLAGLAGLGWWFTVPWRAPAVVYPVSAAELAQARQLLTGLAVQDRITAPRYDRTAFGQAWSDEDRNGCDTRNDVLGAQLDEVVLKAGTHGCVVLAGVLEDAYTGEVIAFERGADTSARVQIDHVVALADAWYKGASAWDAATRTAFANDPRNLLAVEGGANQDKGAADASEWLPPNRGFRCQYAVLQIRVKAAYGVWTTRDEHRALAGQLDTCHVVG